jgi:hypothetical protein
MLWIRKKQNSWHKRMAVPFLAFFVMTGPAHNTPAIALAQSETGADTDPTKPVVFSLREEFYNPEGELWKYAFILRADKAVLKNKGKLSGKRGFLLRSDLPIVMTRAGGSVNTGLGDLYGQALWLPYLTRKFGFALGTGLLAPTATHKTTGAGKWQIAPAAIPIWFFERKGLFFVKFQDYISFAGNRDRAEVHYTNADATLLWKLGRGWWIVTDTELYANWKKSGSTGFKSGLMVGRMLNPTFGVWVKPEIPYGRDSGGGWILKSSFFWVRP